MAMAQPAASDCLAAASFVTMPPELSDDDASPAMASISTVISVTSGTNRAPLSLAGSDVYRPSMSDSRINASALIMAATRAASRSLSPKRISSVATLSFSLIRGTAPMPSNVVRVLRALR